MDEARARQLLAAERQRVSRLLTQVGGDAEDARDASRQGPADMADPAAWLRTEGEDDAVTALLQARLGALDRAESRLRSGTYGRSVRSGRAIPDERLEADPAAELTAEEAAAPE